MKETRSFCAVLALFLLFGMAGCGLTVNSYKDTGSSTDRKGVYATYSYAYSCVGSGDLYVPSTLRERLEQFGKNQWIQQAEPTVQTYTEIPSPENDAKGTDPICILMPDLDLSKFDGPYLWKDAQTGLEASAYYRVVAGIPTDELVRVYVDSSGAIYQYETVNWGKYDSLALDEQQIKGLQSALSSKTNILTGDAISEYFAPFSHPASSWCMLFTDRQDRVILCTRGAVNTDSQMHQIVRQVDLFAIWG